MNLEKLSTYELWDIYSWCINISKKAHSIILDRQKAEIKAIIDEFKDVHCRRCMHDPTACEYRNGLFVIKEKVVCSWERRDDMLLY